MTFLFLFSGICLGICINQQHFLSFQCKTGRQIDSSYAFG
jgi:hypothetical protein